MCIVHLGINKCPARSVFISGVFTCGNRPVAPNGIASPCVSSGGRPVRSSASNVLPPVSRTCLKIGLTSTSKKDGPNMFKRSCLCPGFRSLCCFGTGKMHLLHVPFHTPHLRRRIKKRLSCSTSGSSVGTLTTIIGRTRELNV